MMRAPERFIFVRCPFGQARRTYTDEAERYETIDDLKVRMS